MSDQKHKQHDSPDETPKEKNRNVSKNSQNNKRRQRLLEFLGACEVVEVMDTAEDTVAIKEVEAEAADIVYNGAHHAQEDSPEKEQNNNESPGSD